LSSLVDEQGRPLRLGQKLGEGGEGAVYRVAGSNSQAIKVYASPLTGERIQKIKILTQFCHAEIDRFAAWPSGLVVDERGRPRGLLLPVVEGARDIHQLYAPGSRRKYFPNADWRFLVRVGRNIARAFAKVHDLGLVIGDVNPGSILVLGDGTVRLIDVDSFQVPVPGGRPLLCTVGVPIFLPPELQHASLKSVVRTTNHDAFGLAIMIFQLLMLGRHPYVGRFAGGEISIERAIAEHRFAFSARAADRQMQRPQNTVSMEILPSHVAALFESAFAPPDHRRARPSATEWLHSLGQLEDELALCRRNRSHYYRRSASLCPWCDFELSAGVLLFGVPPTAFKKQYEIEYRQLIDLITAIPQPVPASLVAATSSVVANPAAQEAAKTPGLARGSYIVGLLVIVTGLVLLPRGGLLLILLGAFVLVFGLGARRRRRKPWINAYRAAKSEQAEAAAELEQANRFPAHVAAQAAVARASRQWASLPARRAEKYRQLEQNKRQEQLRQFMQAQLIEPGLIDAIGKKRVALLTAYGIGTAWDIDIHRVQQIPRFGPVLTNRLVAWRQERERAFVYNPSRPLPKDTLIRLDKEIEDAQRRLVDDLRRALRGLKAAHASEPAAAATAAQRLHAAELTLLQAEANVLAAIGRVPT
jgi:DNA-binding helix-hairpin-helix protein with protein kinase domain